MISVIIPTYCRPRRLLCALNSILNQTFQNFEIIVIDDSPNGRGQKVVSDIHDSRIKYIQNKMNLGVVDSRVLGINSCSGDYIAFLDDDDLWNENKLELQHNVMKKNNNIGMVLCDYTINNLVNCRCNYISLKHFSLNFTKEILSSPGPFLQCALIKKKYLLKPNLLFDKRAAPSEDWDFFITLSKKNILIAHIKASLFIWNLSPESQSSQLLNETIAIEYIINKHHNYIKNNTSKINLGSLYRNLAHMFIKINNQNNSYKYYKRALIFNFLSIKNIIFFACSFLFGVRLIQFYFLIKNKLLGN